MNAVKLKYVQLEASWQWWMDGWGGGGFVVKSDCMFTDLDSEIIVKDELLSTPVDNYNGLPLPSCNLVIL